MECFKMAKEKRYQIDVYPETEEQSLLVERYFREHRIEYAIGYNDKEPQIKSKRKAKKLTHSAKQS
jgi:hypothetical protein